MRKGQGSVAIRTWKPAPDTVLGACDARVVVLAGPTEQATRIALYSVLRSVLQEYTMQGDPADPSGVLTIEALSGYDRFEVSRPVTSLAATTGSVRALLDLANAHLPEDYRIK